MEAQLLRAWSSLLQVLIALSPAERNQMIVRLKELLTALEKPHRKDVTDAR